MRIDHLLVSRAARRRASCGREIDREARKGKPIPSDHAPLVIDLDEPGRPLRRGLGLGRGAHRRATRRAAVARRSRSSRRSSRCWRSSPTSCPTGDGWLFEPKWDGFRAIVFRDGERVYIQSRDLKPLDRYFPELAAPLRAAPARALRGRRRDRDRDRARARLRRAAAAPPPGGLARGEARRGDAGVVRRLRPAGRGRRRTCARRPQAERRARLEQALARAPRAASTSRPCTPRPRAWPQDWFHRFEGAGLDGVIAKHESTTVPARASARWSRSSTRAPPTAWSAGFRWHKSGPGDAGRLAAARALRRRRARCTTSA